MSEATALPTAPQPRPSYFEVFRNLGDFVDPNQGLKSALIYQATVLIFSLQVWTMDFKEKPNLQIEDNNKKDCFNEVWNLNLGTSCFR